MRPERKILKRRIELIRALEDALRNHCFPPGRRGIFVGAVAAIREDKDGHFLSRSPRCPSKVSYAGKKEYRFDNSHRLKMSMGRYFRRHLSVKRDEVSDHTLDGFVRRVFGNLIDESMFEVVTGAAIVNAYKDEVGEHSCMTGSCARFTQTYADNPKVASMVIFRSGDHEARALLWKTTEGKQLLDRIYPNDGPQVDAYTKWCQQNKIIMRSDNRAPGGSTIRFKDDGLHRIHLKLKKHEMPYMDSFQFGKFIDDEELELSNDSHFGDLCFEYTNGAMPGGTRCYSCDCEGADYCDDEGEDYCETCYYELYCICEKCDETRSREDSDQIEFYNCSQSQMVTERWCEDCLDSHTTSCSRCGVRVHEDVVRDADDSGNPFCESCWEQYVTFCEECEEDHENTGTRLIGNRTLCTNCSSQCSGCLDWVEDSEFNSETDLCDDCAEEKIEEEADAKGEAVEVISTA